MNFTVTIPDAFITKYQEDFKNSPGVQRAWNIYQSENPGGTFKAFAELWMSHVVVENIAGHLAFIERKNKLEAIKTEFGWQFPGL